MSLYTGHNRLEVFPTIDELAVAAAELIIDIADAALTKKGKFTISLSGGQTPMKLYSILATQPYCEQIKWEKTFIFWGDERCVPLKDKQNNAHQAKIALLDKVNISLSNIHIIPVNLSPAEAAHKYEQVIDHFFGLEPHQFDLVLLGLGENGHTASLFPDTKVISEYEEGVREVYVKDEKMFRVTMTAPLINRAHHILFLVAGKNKAEILEKVMYAPYQPAKYPAQLIKPAEGDLRMFADAAAASLAMLQGL